MDNRLKERLIRHFETEIRQHNCGNDIYMISGNNKYTYNDMIEEFKKESNFSESIVADLIAATCYRLDRSKLFDVSISQRKEVGESYYYLDEFFEVKEEKETFSDKNNRHWSSKNYFKEYLDAVIVKTTLKKFIM